MQSTGGSSSSGLPTSSLRNKYKSLLNGNTAHGKFLNDELDRIDAIPSRANQAEEIALFEENLKLVQQHKKKLGNAKYDKLIKKAGETADEFRKSDKPVRRVQARGKRTSGYHGKLPQQLEEEILRNPDAVYIGTGNEKLLIFQKNGNVVITESVGSKRGNILTSYGPSGPRSDSGVGSYGGSPTDPGLPVTREAIIKGEIPAPGGKPKPPAIQIR